MIASIDEQRAAMEDVDKRIQAANTYYESTALPPKLRREEEFQREAMRKEKSRQEAQKKLDEMEGA